MKTQYYPSSDAGRQFRVRTSLEVILVLATPLLVWGQAGQDAVTFTRITTGPIVSINDNDGFMDLYVPTLRTVEATDDTGTYLSNPCQLTVYDKPVITQQPQPVSVLEGKNTNLTVTAISATPIRYQWRFNSATLADRTNATLSLTSVQPQDDGLYDAVVSNDFGSVTSNSAQLTVLQKLRITLLATNYTVVQGRTVLLSVECTGTLPMTYRWRRNSTTLMKETLEAHQSFLVLSNVQPHMGGPSNRYTVILTSAASSMWGVSSNIYLTVLPDTDGDGMDDAWETNYPTCTEPDGDADQDGLTNKEEYDCGTDPAGAQSYLKVERIAVNGEARIEFNAAANVTYTVLYAQCITNALADDGSAMCRALAAGECSPPGPDGHPVCAEWHKLTDVVASPTSRTVVVTDPAGASQRFYRLITPRQP